MLRDSSSHSINEKTPLLSVLVEDKKVISSEPKPLLYDELLACIEMLHEMKKTKVPAKLETLDKNKKCYTGLGIFNVTALLAVPAITLTTTLKFGHWLYETLLPGWQEQIKVLNQKIANATQDENSPFYQNIYDYLTGKASPWLGQYSGLEQEIYNGAAQCDWTGFWAAHTDDNRFPDACWQTVDVCWFASHPNTQTCTNVSKLACETYQHIAKWDVECFMKAILPAVRDDELIEHLKPQIAPLQALIDKGTAVEPISMSIFGVATGLSVAAAIYLMISWYRARKENSKDVSNINMVGQYFDDSPEATRIKKIMARFNLNSTETTIDELIKLCESKIIAIRARFAFFKGLFDEEATNHHFLVNDGDRDITRIILREAVMLPGPVR